MTAKVSDYKNVLYTRDFSLDLPPQVDLVKRVAVASLPFLCLHRALRAPISIVMGALRVWNVDKNNKICTAVAVIALASSIFRARVGMVVTTLQDIGFEIQKLRSGKSWEEASTCLVKIFNDLLYLALISRGGLELSIIAFAVQAVVQMIRSRDEFKKGRWIEGVASLAMAAVRLNQSFGQYKQLKRNWEIQAAIKRIEVGKLHEKWRFPSDHLPVGVEVNGVKVISWNVLNNAYMEWVTEKDSQGLNGSMISELNVPVGDTGLTMRDIVVAEMVENMMAQGHVVALQECSQPFLEYLQTRLPSDWEMVKSFDTARVDQDILLYNKTHLTYQRDLSETSQSAYPSVPGRPLQNAYFSSSDGHDLRIVNVHTPGDFALPGPEELANYVYKQHREGDITLVVGDHNFERDRMISAYEKSGFTDFSLHSPYKTNVDPETKQSKGIDHVGVFGDATSRDLTPGEVLTRGNLQETIQLLNHKRT